jgi:hypothetical protein
MKITLTNSYSQQLDIYDETETDFKVSSGVQRMIEGNAMEDVVAVKKRFEVKAVVENDLRDFMTSSLILTIDDKKYNVIFDGEVNKTRLSDNLWDVSFKLVEV